MYVGLQYETHASVDDLKTKLGLEALCEDEEAVRESASGTRRRERRREGDD